MTLLTTINPSANATINFRRRGEKVAKLLEECASAHYFYELIDE